jgi:hypothetical protein
MKLITGLETAGPTHHHASKRRLDLDVILFHHAFGPDHYFTGAIPAHIHLLALPPVGRPCRYAFRSHNFINPSLIYKD